MGPEPDKAGAGRARDPGRHAARGLGWDTGPGQAGVDLQVDAQLPFAPCAGARAGCAVHPRPALEQPARACLRCDDQLQVRGQRVLEPLDRDGEEDRGPVPDACRAQGKPLIEGGHAEQLGTGRGKGPGGDFQAVAIAVGLDHGGQVFFTDCRRVTAPRFQEHHVGTSWARSRASKAR